MKKLLFVLGMGLAGLGVAQPVVTNPGFELPNVPTDTMVFQPVGNGWNMGPTSGIADGSTGYAPNAHSGSQYAVIDAHPGQTPSIGQTVTGFQPGQLYKVRYFQARSGRFSYNSDPCYLAVYVDGIQVSGGGISNRNDWSEHETPPFTATSASHVIEFRAFYWHMSTGSTSLLDDISVELTTDSLADLNGSFEAPVLPIRHWRYGSTGAGSKWYFSGQVDSDTGAGIATKDSTWSQTAGHGNQVAFVQAGGYMERTLRGLQYGHPYTVQFMMNRRPVTSPGVVNLLVNNVPLMAGLTPDATQWSVYESPVFVPSATKVDLRFQGVDLGRDSSVLFDAVRILPLGFADFTVTPSGIVCGNTAMGHVTISRPAPAGGAAINLQPSDPLVKVPATVTIPAGQVTASFQITTGVTATSSMKQIQARFGLIQKTRNLWVYPAELSNVAIVPASIVGGNSAVGTVTLNGTASANYIVSLTSSGPQLVVPANVQVLNNKRTADFAVTTIPVSGTYTRYVTATRGNRTRTYTVTITPS